MAPIRTRRSRRAPGADPREVGFAAAMGLAVETDDEPVVEPGRRCRTCGAEGRLDMVDTTIQRAFFTCPSCGRNWDTDRVDVIDI